MRTYQWLVGIVPSVIHHDLLLTSIASIHSAMTPSFWPKKDNRKYDGSVPSHFHKRCFNLYKFQQITFTYFPGIFPLIFVLSPPSLFWKCESNMTTVFTKTGPCSQQLYCMLSVLILMKKYIIILRTLLCPTLSKRGLSLLQFIISVVMMMLWSQMLWFCCLLGPEYHLVWLCWLAGGSAVVVGPAWDCLV